MKLLITVLLFLMGCAVKYPVYECKEKESKMQVFINGEVMDVISRSYEPQYIYMPIKEGK